MNETSEYILSTIYDHFTLRSCTELLSVNGESRLTN
jgi:hypothetical protein